jgi:hypothetical protein
MKKSTQKAPRKRMAAPKSRKTKILDALTGSDALSILRVLAERNSDVAREIDAVAKELLRELDVESLAEDVKEALECLDVEEVWDRSGENRDGYVDPGDAAWEMFEETLEPFCREIEKYRKLSMWKEANLCYQGIMKGIHDFERESSTEYKQWAVDAPAEFFGRILDEWKALSDGRGRLSDMQDFIDKHCPSYAEWGARLLRSHRR